MGRRHEPSIVDPELFGLLVGRLSPKEREAVRAFPRCATLLDPHREPRDILVPPPAAARSSRLCNTYDPSCDRFVEERR